MYISVYGTFAKFKQSDSCIVRFYVQKPNSFDFFLAKTASSGTIEFIAVHIMEVRSPVGFEMSLCLA